ncbi:unnamed protein product, partial [Iphiclides podalirius]
MDHDEERSLSLGTEVSASVPPPSPLTGCYLLAVIGEPHTHEHKEIILQRLVKGEWSAPAPSMPPHPPLTAVKPARSTGRRAFVVPPLAARTSHNTLSPAMLRVSVLVGPIARATKASCYYDRRYRAVNMPAGGPLVTSPVAWLGVPTALPARIDWMIVRFDRAPDMLPKRGISKANGTFPESLVSY